jgi:hypothetical protein
MSSFKNMTENITLPPNLNAAIGSEKKDFAILEGVSSSVFTLEL